MAKIVIIGGGLSGLSLAYFLKENRPSYEILLLEKESILGGKARTAKNEGFLVELGVNGVLDNKPSTVGLAKRLGLEILMSNQNSKRRFVVKDSGLKRLPESPVDFLSSDLLSISGRLRVLMEPFIPKAKGIGDESLESFAIRRLGTEAFKRLIDPMATGIFAGDPSRLSLMSCFPRIWELESQYGSLIRAMIRLTMEAKRAKSGKKVEAGPGGNLVSFNEGMSELVNALKEDLGPDIIKCSSEVTEIIKKGRFEWEVHLKNSEAIECSHVVLSCPAKETASLTRDSIPELSSLANSIDYPPIAIVAFGIRPNWVDRDINGFGFLSPGSENRSILGTLWDSSIFPNRAPAGWVLLRTLLGGARRRDIPYKSNQKLIDLTYQELKELMGLKKAPDYIKIHRWRHAIPQYNIGHQDRVEKLFRILKKNSGLFVRCNWVGGVSLNDCIQNSFDLANGI